MNKTIILLLILVILSMTTSAYQRYELYHGVKIKFMHYAINRTECYMVLDQIPEEYYNGLRYIRIYQFKDDRLGQYHWLGTRGIDLISGCDLYVLQEELAHHIGHQRGNTIIEEFNHLAPFWKNLREIENKTRYEQ